MITYPLPERWRKFRPHLESPIVREIENLAMGTLHPEYVAGRHIPRESGNCLDLPWPRSRTGYRAYQCFGHCHSIAPVMLTLARLADPSKEWSLVASHRHTTVVSLIDGEIRSVLDINSAGKEAISQLVSEVLAYDDHWYESDVLKYIDYRLVRNGSFPFRYSYPMRPAVNQWKPEEGSEIHYPERNISWSDRFTVARSEALRGN